MRKSTLYDYRSYLKNDFAPALGEMPLTALSRDDSIRVLRRIARDRDADTVRFQVGNKAPDRASGVQLTVSACRRAACWSTGFGRVS